VALAAALVAACGGGNPTATGAGAGATTGATTSGGGGGAALPTGVPVTDVLKLCNLLGPGDFAAAGIAGAGTVTANYDDGGAGYCTYTTTSAAQGGIEFDAFVDASAADAQSTYDTITQETDQTLTPVTIPGADAAVAAEGTPGDPAKFAAVVVRKGNLSFTIGVPSTEGVLLQLTALSTLVLARAAAVTG
jgi:hypothetical protein